MDSLLLIDDVCNITGFRKATIENWIYGRKPAPDGFPKPVKVGRVWRFKRSDFQQWIEKLGNNKPTIFAVTSDVPLARPRGRPKKL